MKSHRSFDDYHKERSTYETNIIDNPCDYSMPCGFSGCENSDVKFNDFSDYKNDFEAIVDYVSDFPHIR